MGEFFRHIERQAGNLRRQLHLSSSDRLEPTAILERMGIDLYQSPFDIPGMSAEYAAKLCDPDCGFSGAAAEILGHRLVLLNPSHSPGRQRVTTMEEVAHFLYGHEPSCITLLAGFLPIRDYHKEQEKEAYALAAASLLPASEIDALVRGRRSMGDTTLHFGVSKQLVEYRIKTTGRWAQYKQLRASGPLIGLQANTNPGL